MREQLQARLAELKREFETGEARLRELESQKAQLSQTLLRISGAIQVLEETLSEASNPDDAATPDASDAARVS